VYENEKVQGGTMKVQILVKNSKYGHDYEVVRADAFFNNKDLEENYREKKQEEWHEFLKNECGQEINEDDYVDWYGDMDPIQLQVQEEL
jgi:hypothetical protein